MKQSLVVVSLALAFASGAATAQNITTVNGKPVPKARVDALLDTVKKQAAQRGQQLPPDIDKLARDKVVNDEILVQEAERRGLSTSGDYRTQMDLARQSILIGLLDADVEKKAQPTDVEVQAEYDKFKAQASGPEFRARHILVEKEDEAKALIAQIKAGGNFEELAKKNSKDPGSGANGGDLDFASPSSYVQEFSSAMVKLKKGEMTQEPVKSQFGYHIIRLDDVREAQFPPLAEVSPQIRQRLAQQKKATFRDDLVKKAKTDYKLGGD